MSDRGMKKWAPYASLIEQASYVRKTLFNKHKVKRPHLSSDQAEDIERLLSNPQAKPYEVTYFSEGFILKAVLFIKKVDVLNKKVVFDKEMIAYRDLLHLTLIDQ